MPPQEPPEIYMVKKSADGFVVCFRAGAARGVRPGMRLEVVNEEGFPVGRVTVVATTDAESEALVVGEGRVTLGCRVSLSAADPGG